MHIILNSFYFEKSLKLEKHFIWTSRQCTKLRSQQAVLKCLAGALQQRMTRMASGNKNLCNYYSC
jgi:hypothetical protein